MSAAGFAATAPAGQDAAASAAAQATDMAKDRSATWPKTRPPMKGTQTQFLSWNEPGPFFAAAQTLTHGVL
jgi:hypothetical protein